MRRKHLLVLCVLLVAMLALSGCGVPTDEVDFAEASPDGWWQVLVVWPLATALVGLNDFLNAINIPFSWGFAIILFTLAIKIVTLPLTMSQLRGMQAQKDLQPKLKELQNKYGKDRERLSQEQMKLYKEAGVNPLSGCLPLLVQMPVLFGLYSALLILGSTLENARFFWIPDLGFPAYHLGLSWISEDFNSGNYGHLIAYLVLPVLLIVSQFVTQKMTTPTTPGDESGQANMMKQMSVMMSLMFGFFTLQVPAGLSLYWVTSNLLQLLQQWLVTNYMMPGSGPKPALAVAGAGKAVSGDNGASRETAVAAAVAGETVSDADTLSDRTRRRNKKRKGR